MRMRRKIVIALVATLCGSGAGMVRAQSQEPAATATPVPGAASAPLLPGARKQPRGVSGGLPQLPHTPLKPETLENLPPDVRKRVEELRKPLFGPDATFEDYVKFWRTPRPYPKSSIVRLDAKHAQPHPAVPWTMEIVREEGDTVWLRALPPENPKSPIHKEWLMWEQQEANLNTARKMLTKPYYVDFETPIVPPAFQDELRFVPKSRNLPERGRWQMNLALADMNGDGNVDLVAPPPRKGGSRHPIIFLGDGHGGFSVWEGTSWSRGVGYDYGGIAVGDVNGDHHQDIVLAVHFGRQYVLFGDGKGHFDRSLQLPSPDPRETSRAVRLSDLDGDGDLDMVFLAEIGVDMQTKEELKVPLVWTLRNAGDGTRWTVESEGLPKWPSGDRIAVDDLDGDGRPDIVIGSTLNGWRAIVYLNHGKDGWKFADFPGILSEAYHFDVTTAPADGSEKQPVIWAAFTQFKRLPGKEGPSTRTGIVAYHLDGEAVESPGTIVTMLDNRTDPFFRIAAGDLDGDGRTDLVAAQKSGTLHVFIQQADGSFSMEKGPEPRSVGRPFDLHVIDLDGDGLGDIVGSFAESGDLPGGIRVWLTRDGS